MDKHLRILLVDDDEDEYILLKGIFSRLPGRGNGNSYVLDWVSTFEQALESCTTIEYDIHLVDYHLGRYNGLDLMRAAEERGCTSPFILLTGQGSYELDLAAMQQGVADYLSKDQINEYVLERSIRYALERKQAQEDLELRVQERTQELAKANEELKNEMVRRTHAEETLRESEARFRTLAETTSAAIFIVQDQVIRYANPAARFVTGFSPEELLGRELWTLAHPDYQPPLKQSRLVSQWARGVPVRYEIKIITRQGQERWVDLTAGSMLFEGTSAWLFTAFDITERDLAEQGLRRAKAELEQRVIDRTAQIQAATQRLQTVLRTLPVALVITNRDLSIDDANKAFQDLWDSEGPLPKEFERWSRMQAWWSETGEPLEPRDWPLAQAVLEGEMVIDKMIDILTLKGQRKTIINSAVPIFDASGDVISAVAVAQDVTHQRQLEQQAHASARESRQRADELDGLHRATAALLSTLELDDLLCQILDAAQSAIPAAERGMLHLISPSTGQLQMRATLGFKDERIHLLKSTRSQTYPAQVVRDRKPRLVADVLKEGSADRIPAEMQGVRSIIFAPLYFENQVLGTLSLNSTQPGVFTEVNLRLLVSFAATTAAALQNALLHAEVKQLAIMDPLTGEYNRRAFFDLAQREIERFLRYKHPLSAIMLDLDNFKQINDTFGHATGDQILRMLAGRCRANIRENDIFGRYGGDEFVLVLPDTEINIAAQIANRIRDTVITAPWVTEQGLVPVSVSMGVTQAREAHKQLEELLAEADQALYKAKAHGRNRVELTG
jgi:diguanylate cyclase (GGDEF)-like protein/PAS domain S-box-containing protein